MPTTPSWFAACATAFLAGACNADSYVDESNLVPAATSFDTPGLQEGDFVLENGLGVVIPPPGASVELIADGVDGVEELTVSNDEVAGIVVTRRQIASDVPADDLDVGVLAASPGQCNDDAFNIGNGTHWTAPYRWYVYAPSAPDGMTVTSIEQALVRAVNNITKSQNTCGLEDRVSASHSFGGRLYDWAPNINGTETEVWCGTQDNVNTVGFGTLPYNYVGVACTWRSNGAIAASDVMFNSRYHKFSAATEVPSNCYTRFMLESIATHEFGHSFGLGHVAEDGHAKLTMSEQLGPCTLAETTLGLGDVRGLRRLY
jgi:hypothetical protein